MGPRIQRPQWLRQVASAGDVNGDNYDDVIVGAYCSSDGQSSDGQTFVYHGSAAGLSPSPQWTAESNQANAYFGYSVGSAGDVNGDGYDYVIIGAFAYDHGQPDEGQAYVYFGSAAAPAGSPKATRRWPSLASR
ncbi:MAG: integrin alpha [Anaerolineae bacterium]